ncbi:MAG: HAD family phosphatase [Chloroflexi bacterium]|nr:HAD family phosphatase [Chloroflexota bacterium]
MTRHMETRGVVFDWGGVLQRTVDPAPREALAAEVGLSRDALEEAIFGSAVWDAASRGECPADAAWEAIAEGIGWPVARLDDLVERFFAGDRVDEALVRLIEGLRAGGVPVGLLSNAPPGRARGASSAGRWGMEGLFDAQVFSYEVGVLKPHRAMYERILGDLGLDAEGVLFIDDVPENVAAARAAGMDGLLFRGTTALYDALRQRGLPVPPEETP